MEERIAQLESAIAEIQKFIAAFNIDKQLLIHKDKTTSGIGTKVSVNSDGLVINVKDLSPSDIPTLPMSKIDGLPERLDNTVSRSQMESLDDKISKVLTHGETTKTGAKVNVDSNGLVNDVLPLTQEDIPQLNMDKIDGLAEAINMMKSAVATRQEQPTQVQQVQNIEIPESITNKLAELESSLGDKALKSDITQIYTELESKRDKSQTTPGSYSVVEVNDEGIVTGGRNLTLNDIPQLSVSDINGLPDKLATFADREVMANIIGEVHALNDRVINLDEVMKLQTSLEATISKVNQLQQQVNEISATISNIFQDHSTQDELLSLRKEISSIKSSI